MKIEELAALVTVRNHIFTVINDKSVTARDDFRPLEAKRRELDLKFIQIMKDHSIEDFFSQDVTVVKLPRNATPDDLETWKEMFDLAKKDPNFTIFSSEPVEVQKVDLKQLELFQNQHQIDEISLKTDTSENVVRVIPEKVEELEVQSTQSNIENLDTTPNTKILLEEKKKEVAAKKASQDPEIADAIERQKAELKKQGRSNKKVVKANGTTG